MDLPLFNDHISSASLKQLTTLPPLNHIQRRHITLAGYTCLLYNNQGKEVPVV
jgi:hypothetical protein